MKAWQGPEAVACPVAMVGRLVVEVIVLALVFRRHVALVALVAVMVEKTVEMTVA